MSQAISLGTCKRYVRKVVGVIIGVMFARRFAIHCVALSVTNTLVRHVHGRDQRSLLQRDSNALTKTRLATTENALAHKALEAAL